MRQDARQAASPSTALRHSEILRAEIDTLMRLLEERMEDPNLGPVYLRGGKQRADSFIEDSVPGDDALEPGEVSQPEVLPYSESETPFAAEPSSTRRAPHELGVFATAVRQHVRRAPSRPSR